MSDGPRDQAAVVAGAIVAIVMRHLQEALERAADEITLQLRDEIDDAVQQALSETRPD